MGKLTKQAKNPIIAVAFDDNQAPIEEWRDWLNIAITDLKTRFHFKKLNGIGYSNGGLALSAYVQKYHETPNFQKLIILGAPYNDLDEKDNAGGAEFDSVPHETDMLKSFLNRKKKEPKRP